MADRFSRSSSGRRSSFDSVDDDATAGLYKDVYRDGGSFRCSTPEAPVFTVRSRPAVTNPTPVPKRDVTFVDVEAEFDFHEAITEESLVRCGGEWWRTLWALEPAPGGWSTP